MRRSIMLACAIVICSACALASDFSSLPLDAQKAISAAINRDVAQRNPAAIQDFTLTASNGANGDEFGTSVAIDGDTVVVGSYYAQAAYVFVKSRGGWQNMTQTAKLSFSQLQNGYFGYTVAISGNTIVVLGNNFINGTNQDVACVFVKPAGGWTNMTETADLTASDLSSGSGFTAVAISGNTIMVGAPNYDGGLGTTYVFVEPTGGWTNMTQTAELTETKGVGYDGFGVSVGFDNNTVVVGAPGTCSCSPPAEVYVFVEPTGGWANMTQTAQLTLPNSQQGNAGSVSITGDTAVANSVAGLYVFVEPPGGWVNMTPTATLAAGVGGPVAISGNVILASNGQGPGNIGYAYIFLKPAGGWQNTSKYNSRIKISFPDGDDGFGDAVAISGKTGVVGAYLAPTSPPCKGGRCQAGPGEAFVFVQQ